MMTKARKRYSSFVLKEGFKSLIHNGRVYTRTLIEKTKETIGWIYTERDKHNMKGDE